jgi:carbon monoxide dehydrogenase subunit G
MKMASEQQIAAPRQTVWEALNDPEILRASIPGCQVLDKVADDRFSATVEVKVGPIGARFKGTVSLADLDPPNGYTLNLEGNGGIAGSAKGSAKVRLRENAGGTLVSYDVDAQVGGRMAQLGGPIIDATSKQLAGKFFSRFGEIVGGKDQAEGAAGRLAPSSSASAGKAAAHAAAPSTHATASAARSGALPMAWILAVVVAGLAGFLIGRGAGGAGSDWAGLAIGLLVIVVAGAAFEYGRRAAAAPVVMLDIAALRRLIEGAREEGARE